MKKGIIGLMTACMLFNLVVVSHTQKVEAATYEKASSISVGDTVLLACSSKSMELDGFTTSGTIYGKGTSYSSTPSGKYPLTVVQGSSAGTYALKTGDGKYLNWSSGNSLSTATTVSSNTSWKITFSSGNATIENAKDSTRKLQWNAGSPRFACYTSSQTAVCLFKEPKITTECDHTYAEAETPQYKKSDATCTSAAIYFEECTKCHAQGTNTFEYGDPLPHNYQNGVCVDCDAVDTSTTPSERVSSIFVSYYNEGSYTKYSVLNTNKIADAEVKKYFHAGADTKYRRTDYTPDGLKMTISDTEDGEYTNESIYKNEGGKVVHTGLGGDWTVNKPSVEDWFVTLKDFVDNPGASWTYENGVYSHDLVPATATEEDELTRMAREFVAPMWLAPNKDNYTYAPFTKLTVEEIDETLVMKLYVDSTNSGILVAGSNNVFSQVTISKGSESLSTLAVFEFGANGAAEHKESTSALTGTKTYEEGSYTLNLTSMSKVYADNTYDAKGNSCIKLGAGSAVGSFSFTVPEDVNEVVINVAGYKDKTVTVKTNGTTHNISTLSNYGEYTPITVDTSTTKTVIFETTSTGYRCMINSIEYHK